jgi:alkylhydroperoxidase family enzyme
MNLRFAGAKQQGLTEDLVGAIDDGYRDSALPERHKLAVAATDALVRDPAGLSDELRGELLEHFEPAEIVELLMTAAFASAFSKAAVTWGPPPHIPLMEVPTPTPDPADRQ